MGVRCSNASFEKNIFLFVRASSANSKFRLFFSGFEVRCLWWCWRAVQRLFLLLKSSGRVYYDCYYYPKGVGKEKGTGRGRYREKRPHGRETLTPSSVVTILNSKDSFCEGYTRSGIDSWRFIPSSAVLSVLEMFRFWKIFEIIFESFALRMERRTAIVFWVLRTSNGLADSNYFNGFRVRMGRPIFFYFC